MRSCFAKAALQSKISVPSVTEETWERKNKGGQRPVGVVHLRYVPDQAFPSWVFLAASPTSHAHSGGPAVSIGSTDVWLWCSLCSQTTVYLSLLSNSLPQWGRSRAENQEWPPDITTQQESGLRCAPAGSKTADSRQSRIASICVPRWRWEESSHRSMFSCPAGLPPDAQYRTDRLNAKLLFHLQKRRCFFIAVLLWWERDLQHCLGTTNCLLSILLGNDRS